jgi:S1-C subfamily serine protease
MQPSSSTRIRFWLPAFVGVLILAIGFASSANVGIAQGQAATAPATAIATGYLGILTNATPQGIVVTEVVPGSPADVAGFRAGDVITSVNGAAIDPTRPLSAALAGLPAGTQVTIVVTHGDSWHALKVTLGERPNPTTNAPTVAPGATGVAGGAFLGVGMIDGDNGTQIAQVVPGSAADRAGLQVNDILVSIDGRAITSVAQVRAILSVKAPGQTMTMAIQRSGQPLTVTVTLGSSSTPPALTMTAAPVTTNLTPQPYSPGASRTELGVAYEVVTDSLAAAQKLTVKTGALIIEVQPNSPADFAGIKIGDVITEVDGDKVDAKHTLAIRMIAYNTGDTLTLTVVRGADTLHVSVTLAARGVA